MSNNEVMSALSIMPETKSQQEVFVNRLVDAVVNGNTDPLKAEAIMANLEQVVKAYRSNSVVKQMVYDRVKKRGGRTEEFNAKFSISQTRVDYDYYVSPYWKSLNDKIKALKEEQKNIENSLKVCNENLPFIDKISGEQITFCPKDFTETVKVNINN